MGVFGKANFGGNKRNWFKLKDGESTYRILPPMGDCAKDGRWSVYYKIHYGYKNSDDKMRTFESPEVRNRKTKMIEVPDAALDRINALKAELKKAQDSKNEELVKKLLTYVGGKKSRYNLDSNHYMNVIDLQGNIGILKIRHRAKLALDTVIKTLRDRGIEPLDPESGRYFTFTRSGMGMDTVYQVTVYKKRINVPNVGEVEQDVVHQITDEIAARCVVERADGTFNYKEAGRLDMLFKRPTAEEVRRIVEEGPTAVDEIFDSKGAVQEEDDSGIEGEDEVATTSAPAPALSSSASALLAAAAAANAPQPVTPPVQQVPVVLTPEPVKATPPSAPQTTAQVINSQSDDEFLAGLFR